jgi:hypothetical protein
MIARALVCSALLMLGIVAVVPAGTKAPTPTPTVPEAKPARVLKEFPSYHRMGRHWRNIVVAADNSIEALTALARRLHREDPKSAFTLFTDGNEEQFRHYMLWDLHYSQPDSATYPYPQAWADRHYIATIMLVILNLRDRRWQLTLLNATGVYPPVYLGHPIDVD